MVAPKFNDDFIFNQYKEIVCKTNNKFDIYKELSFDDIKNLCFKNSVVDDKILKIALELYPFNLDKYGHPFFLKEYVRYLLDNGEFDKASSILNNNNIPSVKMMPTNWSLILYARAYEKHKMINHAYSILSKLYIFNNEEVNQSLLRIRNNFTINFLDKFLSNKIDANFIFPLGEACRPAEALRRSRLRYFSCPFDWMKSYSLNTIVNFFKNGIDNFFRDYEIIRDNKTNHIVKDKVTGMISMHDFVSHKTIKDQYHDFIVKMRRRFNRLMKYLYKSQNIVILSNRTNQYDDIINFSSFISSFFNKYAIYINICDKKHESIDIIQNNKYKIINISFNDFNIFGRDINSNPDAWLGNCLYWDKILTVFNLKKLQIY